MTEEQYKKVISLDKRLKEMKKVYNILDNNDTHLSYYYYKNGWEENKLCSSEELSPIKDILIKYENIIRLEVKGEIENIKKQISEI